MTDFPRDHGVFKFTRDVLAKEMAMKDDNKTTKRNIDMCSAMQMTATRDYAINCLSIAHKMSTEAHNGEVKVISRWCERFKHAIRMHRALED